MELKFTSYAWEDYKYWEKQDSRTLKKINALIDSLLREPGASGIGKSERLSGNLSQVVLQANRHQEPHGLQI